MSQVRKMNKEALIVQQERRAKRIKVRRLSLHRNHKAILEKPIAKLQLESKQTEQSSPMIATASNFANTDMVFPRSTFPCHENSTLPGTLHVSATDNSKRFRNNPLSSFNGDFTGKLYPGLAMKRACSDDVYNKPEGKKMCFDSIFPGKEEISQADFQMALIKQSISRKKDWVYTQVLQNLGLATPSDTNRVNVISDSQRGGARNYDHNKMAKPFVHRMPHSAQPPSGFINDNDSKKVHDEEGNCYIDSDDYMSFHQPKETSSSQGVGCSRDSTFNGQITQEMRDFDSCDTTVIKKRGLFLTLKINGGVAIDHDSMPRIAAIQSHANKGRRENETPRQHVEAKMTGSTYRATNSRALRVEEVAEEQNVTTKEEAKWWPPSPESMPNDVMSRDGGEGLLKVMTLDDRRAYGLPKQEKKMEVNSDQDEDDDVIVTKVKMAPNGTQRQAVNKMEGLHENPQNEMPALQLDAYGKPINYKEILLHYISQKLKNDSKNTCLENINSVAERPRRNMSMEELCKKLKDTRDKLEQEQLKWKRKLLSSLEVVLIKKIRRLEKETHDVVPEGIVLEGVVNGKREEGMSKEGASIKGSNNDIVAMMEDLTSEGGTVQNIRCKQRTERNSHSVSIIRGYDSA